jgi:hypothetical protein
VVPDFDGPIGRARQIDLWVERVPAHRVDSHVMRVQAVQVLIRVGLGALVKLALLGADQKDLILGLVEVEAGAAAERGDDGVGEGRGALAGRPDRSQRHHVRVDQLVLGEGPLNHAAVRGHREEVHVAVQVVLLPLDLPHRVGVFAAARATAVLGRLRALGRVVDGHGAVVEARRDQVRIVRVVVDAHHAALRLVHKLRVRRVLQREQQDQTFGLLQEIVFKKKTTHNRLFFLF